MNQDGEGAGFDAVAELHDYAARRAITKLLCDYMRGQDRLLPQLHRSVFADDAYVDCGHYKGSADGFVTFAQDFLGRLRSAHHNIGQADIQIAGDHATGEIYFTTQHRIVDENGESDLFVAGRYVDEYCRRAGVWKILRRCELIDWVRTDPAADGFLVSAPGLNMGSRGDADFSAAPTWPARPTL